MIVGALLARNEADRYLPRVLAHLRPYCDELVLVDDASTDATASVASDAGAIVVSARRENGGAWWGAAHPEAPLRALLWHEASAIAGPDGWVLVCDADMELVGITPRDFRLATTSTVVNGWAWPLADAWNAEDRMRVDGHWQAHRHPRVWLAKVPPTPFEARWPRDAIHVGHFPQGVGTTPGLLPAPAMWRHLAYLTPEDRTRKHAAYTTA